MEGELLANVVGTAAALTSIVSFIPQIAKILKERDASSVALTTYLLTVTTFILWVTYGVMIGAWPLILANSCALVSSGVVLFLKWRFRDGDPKDDQPANA